MYRISPYAPALLANKVDLNELLASTNISMVAFVTNAVTRRNTLIDLCNGLDPFAGQHVGTGFTAVSADTLEQSQAALLADILVQAIPSQWWQRTSGATVRFYLDRLRQNDPTHPFIANWKVWAADTVSPADIAIPAWPELAGA